jgi:predicted phosphodiesterase
MIKKTYNKVIAVGDTHGRDTWRKVIEKNPDFDLIIFIGDYFDSFDIDVMTQMHNFRDIIEFKRNNPDKVITLIGNHDFHYTSGCIGSYSGFNYSTLFNMRLELDELIRNGILTVAYQVDKFLFTHAGVTKTWCDENGIDTDDLVNSLNDNLIYKPTVYNFRPGKNRSPYGDDVTQGPLWVRPLSLLDDGLDYIHVVGHTSKKNITNLVDNDYGCILIDAIEHGEYLEILIPDNGDIIVNTKIV